MSRIWDSVIDSADRSASDLAGYGAVGGFGQRPAILVIDATVKFCGDRPEPLAESIKRWRNSCGEVAWQSASRIAEVLAAARAAAVPVFYSVGSPDASSASSGRWGSKNSRREVEGTRETSHDHDIIGPIAPMTGDVVITKEKPSAFFGTPLASRLINLGVDTLICCGGTTSGCVRATVLDSFSYNFRTGVIEDGTFDRTQISHLVNLFDMNQKYADVVPAQSVFEYLAGVRR